MIPVGVAELLAPGAIQPDLEVVATRALAVAYSGILAAAFSNIIVFNGVRLLGPTRVITLQSFVPAMAVVMAYFFLGEPIRPAQVIGGLIIVLGRGADAVGVDAAGGRLVTAARGEPTDVRPPVPPLRDGRPAALPSSSITTARSR